MPSTPAVIPAGTSVRYRAALPSRAIDIAAASHAQARNQNMQHAPHCVGRRRGAALQKCAGLPSGRHPAVCRRRAARAWWHLHSQQSALPLAGCHARTRRCLHSHKPLRRGGLGASLSYPGQHRDSFRSATCGGMHAAACPRHAWCAQAGFRRLLPSDVVPPLPLARRLLFWHDRMQARVLPTIPVCCPSHPPWKSAWSRCIHLHMGRQGHGQAQTTA